MLKTPSKTFGERLTEVLAFQGITDPVQQVEKVAQACKVTTKTAQKYLQATAVPRFLGFSSRLFSLAKDLEANARWLFDGNGLSPEDARFLEYIGSLTEWERAKTFNYGVRLLNNCPKARRLMAMEAAGQISREQLLAAM
jgi:transcriptional regulator with XRE-family HTH domain